MKWDRFEKFEQRVWLQMHRGIYYIPDPAGLLVERVTSRGFDLH